MKIYRYKNSYDLVMLIEKENCYEIWIYTAIHTFSWFLTSISETSVIKFFLEAVKNINYCLVNLMLRNHFFNQEFAKEQLIMCLENLQTLSTKDFEEYACLSIR